MSTGAGKSLRARRRRSHSLRRFSTAGSMTRSRHRYPAPPLRVRGSRRGSLSTSRRRLLPAAALPGRSGCEKPLVDKVAERVADNAIHWAARRSYAARVLSVFTLATYAVSHEGPIRRFCPISLKPLYVFHIACRISRLSPPSILSRIQSHLSWLTSRPRGASRLGDCPSCCWGTSIDSRWVLRSLRVLVGSSTPPTCRRSSASLRAESEASS